ncbi:MAG: hypothetical protein ACK4ND_09465 [Cytophagaceae bacterium]
MKNTLLTLAIIVLFAGFTTKHGIDNCFVSFDTASNHKMTSPDRLPGSSEKTRMVITNQGEVKVSRIDGYRILYNNDKKAPFVNLKVELSDKKSYKSDKKNLLEHLSYLNANSEGMETKELIEVEVNGYKVYGLNRVSIDSGSILGTFIMFPGNGVTVYFYFNNLKPEYRHFDNLKEYKQLRDAFLKEYTSHLVSCMK